MQHGDYRVKLLDGRGQTIGAKARKDIDKRVDVVHCSDVLIIQHGRLGLVKLPDGGLYGGLWSPTCATMVREDEIPEAAARRALEKELGIVGASLELLGDHFFIYPDQVRRLKTTYRCRWDGEIVPNPEDASEIRFFTRDELPEKLAQEHDTFAPTFLGIWEEYKDRLW